MNGKWKTYIIVNIITGQLYAGKTDNIKKRWKSHLYEANRDKPIQYIYKCMKKYGIENFKIIEVNCFETEQEVFQAEINLISNFKLNISKYGTEFGMNMTDGGEGGSGHKHTEETKRKISQAILNLPEDVKKNISVALSKAASERIISEETKQKISDANSGERNSFYGKSHTEESKRKMSEAYHNLPEEVKKSLKDAISKANTGKIMTEEQKQHLSIIMSGENNPFYGKKHTEETKLAMSKPATEEAKRNMSLGWQNISPEVKERLAAEKSKRFKGIPLSEEHKINIGKGGEGRIFTEEHKLNLSKSLLGVNSKPIIAHKDGIEYFFNSIKEACEFLGIKRSRISNFMSKRYINSTKPDGYDFKYVTIGDLNAN